MTKKGEEDSLFVLAEAVIPAIRDGGIGPLVVDINNSADGSEANDAQILLSGCTSNLHLEDTVEILCQGIAIDNDNDPELENVTRKGETTTGTGNWRREVIICPRKSDKLLKKHFTSFRHY